MEVVYRHLTPPSEEDKHYKVFVDGLRDLFNKYSNNGILLLQNKTHSYTGEV